MTCLCWRLIQCGSLTLTRIHFGAREAQLNLKEHDGFPFFQPGDRKARRGTAWGRVGRGERGGTYQEALRFYHTKACVCTNVL